MTPTNGASWDQLVESGKQAFLRGQFVEAEQHFQAAQTDADRPGREAQLATALTLLAELRDSQGQAEQAEPLLRRALELREQALQRAQAEVGEGLSRLAKLYQNQARYAEAEPLYRRALGVFEQAHGPDHQDVAAVFNALGLIYRTQGKYAEAEPLLRRA